MVEIATKLRKELNFLGYLVATRMHKKWAYDV